MLDRFFWGFEVMGLCQTSHITCELNVSRTTCRFNNGSIRIVEYDVLFEYVKSFSMLGKESCNFSSQHLALVVVQIFLIHSLSRNTAAINPEVSYTWSPSGLITIDFFKWQLQLVIEIVTAKCLWSSRLSTAASVIRYYTHIKLGAKRSLSLRLSLRLSVKSWAN